MVKLKITLPDDLKAFVKAQVSENGYASNSQYLSELIRHRRDAEELRQKLLNGINSGLGEAVDEKLFK